MSADVLVSHNRLTGIFASQVGSHIGGAVLGLGFWLFAARTLTPDQVGLGAGLVAAMTLFSMLGLCGVGTLLLERFKFVTAAQRWPLFTTGLLAAAAGGALVTAVWAVFAEVVRFDGVLGGLTPRALALLVVATAVATLCAAFDQGAIGMGAARIQLRRNIVASFLRIGFLVVAVWAGVETGEILLVSWIVGLVGSLAVSRIGGSTLPRSRVTTAARRRLAREHWSAAAGHHVLTLALASGSLMLPVVVASMMPGEETAFFTQARLLADAALAIPFFLTIALFASVGSVEGFAVTARRTVAGGMAMALGLLALAALAGPVVLHLFGGQYARESAPLLMLLLLGGPVLVIKDHVAVLRRLQGRRVSGAVLMALWTAAELTGAVLGGMSGSPAQVCVGWLVASGACAVLALPVLLAGLRAPARTADDAAAADRRLAEFWNSYVEAGRQGSGYFVHHPGQAWCALRGIGVLPKVTPSMSVDEAGSRAVEAVVRMRGPFGIPSRWWGTAALDVPADPSAYLAGPHAQTLRRKIRAARRHGITCRAVAVAERAALLAAADAAERRHRDRQYRVADPSNGDLLDHDLWLLAEGASQEALLLAVIPVSGDCATLRYFRTLGAGEDHSLSRYLASEAVVAALAARGVRWLLDTAPAGGQTNGVRHFQRMVGFRYVRLQPGRRQRTRRGAPGPGRELQEQR